MGAGPVILKVEPAAAVEGGEVALLGERLTGSGLPQVRIGGVPARPTIATGTRLLVPVPPDARSGPVTVETDAGTAEGGALTVGVRLAADLHPVTGPAVAADGTIWTTVSGSRGQQVPAPLVRISPDGRLEGFGPGALNPTGLSLISRRLREPGRGFGWHGMGGSLGVALGPAAVGGLLALGWPWRTVAALLVLPPALGLALLLGLGVGGSAPLASDPPASLRSLLRVSVLLILLVYIFSGIAYWGTLTFLPRLVESGSFVLLLALGAAGQVVSGHLADRGRPDRILFALSLFAGSLLAAFALNPENLFLPAAWLFGFLLFSLEPLQNTLVTGEVPPNARGTAFGITFLGVFGLGSVGAALAGLLLAQGQKGILFGVLGLSLLVSGGLALLVGRRTHARPG